MYVKATIFPVFPADMVYVVPVEVMSEPDDQETVSISVALNTQV